MTKKEILDEHQKLLRLLRVGTRIIQQWKKQMPVGLPELRDEDLSLKITGGYEPYTLTVALVGKFKCVSKASEVYRMAKRAIKTHYPDQENVLNTLLGKGLGIDPELLWKIRDNIPIHCGTLGDITEKIKYWEPEEIQGIFRQDALLADYIKAGLASEEKNKYQVWDWGDRDYSAFGFCLLKLVAIGAKVSHHQFDRHDWYLGFDYDGLAQAIGIPHSQIGILIDIGWFDLHHTNDEETLRVIHYLESGTLGVFLRNRLPLL